MPEVRCEVWVTIADDVLWESEPSVDVIEVEACDLRACYCCHAGEEYCAS